LARHERPLKITQNPETISHLAQDVCQSTLIAQALRQGFGLAQAVESPTPITQPPECKAQIEPQVDGLLTHGTTLTQMLQRSQCLL
jgi:hypothetical protein